MTPPIGADGVSGDAVLRAGYAGLVFLALVTAVVVGLFVVHQRARRARDRALLDPDAIATAARDREARLALRLARIEERREAVGSDPSTDANGDPTPRDAPGAADGDPAPPG